MHRASDSFSIILWAKACKCLCAFMLNRFLSICFFFQNSLIKFLLSIHSLYSWLMAYYFIAFVEKQSLVVPSYYLKILSNIIYEINPWKSFDTWPTMLHTWLPLVTREICLYPLTLDNWHLFLMSIPIQSAISIIAFFQMRGEQPIYPHFSSLNKHLSRWIFHLCLSVSCNLHLHWEIGGHGSTQGHQYTISFHRNFCM